MCLTQCPPHPKFWAGAKISEKFGVGGEPEFPFVMRVCGREKLGGKANFSIFLWGGNQPPRTLCITYQLDCSNERCERKYKGETSYNGYKRGKEHTYLLNGRSEKSPLWKHCERDHNREIQTFSMKVTGTYRNDAMLRQISEAVQIENTETDSLINTRAEWNMTRVPRINILAT